MPWLPDQVDDAIISSWEGGERTPFRLAVAALREVYSTTPDGRPINWPSVTEDCACIRALEHRVQLRSCRLMAIFEDDEAETSWYAGGGF